MALLFTYCFSFSQPIVNRSASILTVQDARLSVSLNLFIPRYTDTTSANLFLGTDSCSAIIFTYDLSTCWIRGCSPKRWIQVGSGSGGGGTLNNLGVGYRFGVQGTSNIKTFFAGYGTLLDSTSHANALTLTVDSTKFYLYSNPLHFLTDTSLVASVLYPLYPATDTTLAIDTGAGRPSNKTYVLTRSLGDSLYGSGSVTSAFNGLTDSVNRVILGGSLYKNTFVDVNSYSFTFSSSGSSATIFTSIASAVNTTAIQGVSSASGAVGIKAIASSGGIGLVVSVIDTIGASIESAYTPTTVQPILTIRRNTTSAVANGIGGSIDFVTTTNSSMQTSNKLVSKWTNSTNAIRTSQFDIIGINTAATETFANFQTGGIVRVNNLADTLSTKAYARSVGGGSGSSLLPTTGTGTATGNIIGSLATFKVEIQQAGNDFLNIDPTSGAETASLGSVNTTGSSNTAQLFTSTSNTDAETQMSVNFNGGAKSADIDITANTTSSLIQYTADKNLFAVSTTTATTTSSGIVETANSLTTGTNHYIASSSLTAGNLLQIVSTSTALAANNEGLDIAISGANGTNAITATGARISVTNTNGTSGTNIGLDVTATGATTANYAINSNGNVFITGQAATDITLTVKGAASQSGDLLQFKNNSNSVIADISKAGGMTLQGLWSSTIGGLQLGYDPNVDVAYISTFKTSYRNLEFDVNTAMFLTGASGIQAMVVDANQNVKIGTGSANSKLHVQGSFATAYVAKTGTYTADATDYAINCTSGTFTVNLPTAVSITGRMYVIKNSGAGTITIDGSGSETIDGVTTKTLSVQYSGMTIMSDGANWIVIATF